MARAALLALALVFALGPGPALSASNVSHAARMAAAALPQDRLHFGLANGPSDLSWMTSSGVPWRYRYQYLSGGVNTGAGWETWNSPSGAFATFYMNGSGNNGYIPVFTYYELLQSTPSAGANESDRDYSNLNTTATMAAYYANFKLLMQMIGTYAKPVVVHVEPDLWGYLQQRAAGGDASSVSASVASSGFADVATLPNTVQGFGYALLKLRDTYGPNAIMALHASGWASGTDINSSRSSSVNAASVADSTATFLNSTGISSNPFGSTWDLVFNDPDDHDAGYWEQIGADNASFTHWWDPTNTTFPNFARYLAWVAELKLKTARAQVAWQVPVGNQYFLTMNNTCGHYQDNVAPYFIANASSLFASGLIAVLFGAGNGCQTSYTNAQNDGITNNGGVPTTDTLGYCSACNSHASVVADDDGGFLRTFVGAYYAGYQSVGGLITADPAVAAASTSEDVFVRGGDGGLWQAHFNSGTFAGWTSLGGFMTSAAGAVSSSTSRTDVFVRGTDNGLWQKTWNGSSWSWMSLGGVATSGPSADNRTGTPNLDMFVRGTDGSLWQDSWNGSSWSWTWLGGFLTLDPGSVSSAANRVDVFVRGSDTGLWHRSSVTGTGWGAWESLGGGTLASPDAASCSAGHLDVFVLGTDYGLWRRGWNGVAWSAWQSLGGSWSAGPAVVCRPGTNTIDIFERGMDGALWQAGTATGS